MARSLLFACAIGLVSAQEFPGYNCDCYGDTTKGFWQGQSCDTCAPGYEGIRCNEKIVLPNSTQCPGTYGFGQITCSGHGDCNLQTGVCTCYADDINGFYTGDDCGACISNYAGYGLGGCASLKCDVATCNDKGTCRQDTIPCGTEGCDPDLQKCCSARDSSWIALGDDAYAVTGFNQPDFASCRPKEEECCGSSSCATGTFCAVIVERFSPTCAGGNCCPGGNCPNLCCPIETTYCERLDPNGQPDINGLNQGQCCEKWEKCCDGQCCASNQACRKRPEPEDGWRGVARPSPGNPVDLQAAPPADGKVQKYCADATSVLQAPTAMRAIVLPLFLIITLIISFIIVVVGTPDAPISLRILAGLITFLCFFPLISPHWPYAVLTCLSCYFALGCIASGTKHRFVYALIATGTCFFVLLGGLGLTAFLFQIGIPSFGPFFPRLNGPGNEAFYRNTPAFDRLQNALSEPCKDYYGFFQEDPRSLDWKFGTDSRSLTWGFCDILFISALHFFQVLILGVFFLFIVLVGKEARDGGSLPSTKAAAGSSQAYDQEAQSTEMQPGPTTL